MTEASIDLFCHCLPPRYCEAVNRSAERIPLMFARGQEIAVMVDLEARLRLMDRFPDYQQVVSLASPALEALAAPEKTPELFEKFLPYALALNVEHEWSEQFADVLKAAAADGRLF